MPNTIDRRMRLRVAFAPQAIATSGEHTIAEMRWFPVQEPVSGSRYSFLRVKTRSGLTGWGECAETSSWPPNSPAPAAFYGFTRTLSLRLVSKHKPGVFEAQNWGILVTSFTSITVLLEKAA